MKLKIITQIKFDKLSRNELGFKEVPSFSDLSQIKNFGKACIFGEWCSFGEGCIFGEWCSFGEGCELFGLKILNYCAVDRVGNSERKLYCWNLEGQIYFQVGRFWGSEKELLERVNNNYPEGSEYHLAINFLSELIKLKK